MLRMLKRLPIRLDKKKRWKRLSLSLKKPGRMSNLTSPNTRIPNTTPPDSAKKISKHLKKIRPRSPLCLDPATSPPSRMKSKSGIGNSI